LVAAHANSPTPVLILRDQPKQAAANSVPAIGPSETDPAAMQDHAETLLEQGRYEDALAAFGAILEIDPDHALAYAGMGDALFRMRRYEDALAALARGVSLQPDLPVAGAVHRLMGRSEQELGRPDEALPHYQRALEIDPDDAQAIELLARLQFVRERYLESFALFETLVAIDPDNADLHANLGAALYHLGRVEDAIRSFEHALSLDPTLETVRTTLDQLRGDAP
jgi:tetratricopeptide (TPR) repeat protein